VFSDLLIHTVQVYRRIEDSQGRRRVDRFGQELSVNPRQHEVDGETLVHSYPCRVNRGKGGMVMAERMVDTFVQRWEMFTLPDVDIITDDACRVLDENGNELVPLSKVMVKSVAAGATGAHHLEFQLWAQSGAS
jgi:hypothetical protein